MKKKVHLIIDGVGGCCNSYNFNSVKTIEAFNDFIEVGDNLVCKHCLNSSLYISKRPLEKEEFEEPKRLKVTFNNGFILVENMIDNQHNDLFKFSKREERIAVTKDSIRLGQFRTDDEPRAKEMLDFISNGFVDVSKVETVRKEKTQLELDTIKYNLNEEQKEYLGSFDYEVVEYTYCDCDGCLFSINSIDCPTDLGARFSCFKNGKEHRFKQVHKSQDSLNKAIEKEDDKQPLDEPFGIQYDVTKPKQKDTIRPSNHSSHYEKKEGLESIEKMELIACHGIPKMYHQKIKSNLNLALAVKYHDRLGKKDETEKEIDKMKNYINRSVKGEWRK
ncbi:MAG: DUF3310 domain-containing protein [Colwellia sp.]|nr:DUF3310 domain-containing protein [Colwellia sp.]